MAKTKSETLTALGRAEAKAIEAATREALAAVCERFGLDLRVGGGMFDSTCGIFRPRVEFALRTRGDGTSNAEAAFTRLAPMFNLKASDFGRVVTVRGTEFRIVGLNPSSAKFPVEAERVRDGKRFRIPLNALSLEFAR